MLIVRRILISFEDANRFLESTYLRDHNVRFARQDHLPDIHRTPHGLDLNNIFCFETTPYVNHDYTITLNARYIQLLTSPEPLPPPSRHVTLRHWLDGSLHIFWNEHELAFKQLSAKPKPKPQIYLPAPHSHPWRDKALGDKRKRARHYFNNT